jgi:flavin reductase (DIM6/NTAB) family NADH-FMN oxidoreductase RutF
LKKPSSIAAIEVKIIRTHVNEELLIADENNYIDPDKWKPLIMSFCEYDGISGKVRPSRLATIFAPV